MSALGHRRTMTASNLDVRSHSEAEIGRPPRGEIYGNVIATQLQQWLALNISSHMTLTRLPASRVFVQIECPLSVKSGH